MEHAKGEESKGRLALADIKTLLDREQRRQRTATRHAAQAQDDQEVAERGGVEARRRIEEARRAGGSRHRWESAAQQRDAEAERLGTSIRRFEDETRRQGRGIKDIEKEVRDQTELVSDLFKTTHSLQQRVLYLQSTPQRVRNARESANNQGIPAETVPDEPQPAKPPAAPTRLSITSRAADAIADLLDRMQHTSAQLLRLNVDDLEVASLKLDSPKPEDHIVSHDGKRVLLIDQETHERVGGKTLDTNASQEGTEITLN